MAPSATILTQQYASIDVNENPLRVNSHTNHHGKEYGRILTKKVLKGRIEAIDTDTCAAGDEDAFFVADMGEVYRQHLRWKMNLKRVKPHYGTFSLVNLLIIERHADVHKLLSATRIQRYSVCLLAWAPVLTVHPSQKLNKSSISVSIHLGSSMLSLARPSHMYASQLNVGSSR